MNKLKEKVAFSFWKKYDDNHTAVRFATSWATTNEDIEELRKIIRWRKIMNNEKIIMLGTGAGITQNFRV